MIFRVPGVGVEGSQAIKNHLRNRVVFLLASPRSGWRSLTARGSDR